MFNRKYLAVDIGNKNIKIVHGMFRKGKVEITEYGIIDTPVNSIRDGKISNLSLIAKCINDVSNEKKMSAKRLILNVSGTGVITRDIQVPKASLDEIEKMLEFEAQQYFPVDLSSYVIDFKILEEIESQEGIFYRIFLAAVPVKQVEEYMKLSELLKMNISAIDIPANCVLKLIFDAAPKKGKEGTKASEYPDEFAVIDIGHSTTGVCIFSDRKLKFNRILHNGSGDIDKYISTAFDFDFKEAENRKIIKGHILENDSDYDEDLLNLSNILKQAVDNLAVEINRFFEFYSSRNSQNRLEKIYICGGGSRLKGLEGYLSGFFNVPVEALKPGSHIEYKGRKNRDAFNADYALLINAIGAMIRD